MPNVLGKHIAATSLGHGPKPICE
jgi:hypothetical protein